MKRILSFTLALIMALTVLPMSAFATEVTVTDESLPAVIDPASTEAPAEVEVHYQTVTHTNPLYFSEPVITSVTEYHYSTQYLANLNFDDYHSEADVIKEISEHLNNRETAFTVYVKVDAYYDKISSDLFYGAMKHTGKADEGDYIRYQFRRFDAGISYFIYGDTYVQIDYIISYYADAAQEAAVDNKVSTVLAELNVNGKSDYVKIKAIYDYICLNVVYDHDNLNDPTYLLKHSAYAALINGKAVCQGYALLFYRLALELGIDCRIVTGQSNGQNHAWNIVKLNGKYYNVDSTWDAEYFDKRGVYNYFLKSDADFDDHIRDAEHSSESFYAEYPMHTESYDVNLAVLDGGKCGENLTWELTNRGTLTISGTGSSYDYGWVDDAVVETPWRNYVEQIKEIVLNEGITSIDGDMLYGIVDNGDGSYSERPIPNVTTINIPASVTDIGGYAFDGLFNLTEITVDENNKHFISLDGVLYSADRTELLAYPGEYSATTYEIPEGVQYMLTNISNIHLDELVLPESLIYASMVSGTITKVTFKSMNTYIEEWPGAIEETAIIYGYEGSTAQDYAEKYNRQFESMGSAPVKVVASGKCGDNVTWGLTNYGILTIDGTGDMYQYGFYYDENEQQVFSAEPWESYADDIIKINIGAGITYVCEYSVEVYNLEEFNVDEANTEYCDVDGVLYNKAVTHMIVYPYCYSASVFVAPETVEHINNIRSNNLRKVILPESVDQVNYIFGDYIERIEFHSADIHFNDIYVGDACVIYGCEGSFAQQFAEENGLTFKSLEALESSGDINGDEKVDKNDAIYLLYSVLFGDTQYPLNQTCDFNGDGAVDKNDAIYLLYHALFGSVSYPLN